MPLVFRGSRAQLSAHIRAIVAALSGSGPDVSGIAGPVLTRGAVAALSCIQGAFIAKSRGGTGSDGITWAPLKRSTIAQRRTTAGERKALGISGRRERGLLTPAENKRWKGIFASTMAQLRARGVGEGEAMGIAARRAWAILKASGAKTKLDVLGSRKVDSLRDTGVLFQSFTPGYEESPAKPDGQLLDVKPGSITVGTLVPYAAAHHFGVPGRIPARPFWPEELPEAWGKAVADALSRGIVKAVTLAVNSAA